MTAYADDMANRTKPETTSVSDFVATVDDAVKRADAERLIALMGAASGEPAVMWGPSIIGFGSYHYRYASGREGDAPAIAFSPRKAAISLYITGDNEARADLLDRLGTHRRGKGCLYVKRLADIDEQALGALIDEGLARAREFDTST